MGLLKRDKKKELPEPHSYPGEHYQGEVGQLYELRATQLSFYRWGSIVWKIVVVMFILNLVLTSLCCVLSMLTSTYASVLIKKILETITDQMNNWQIQQYRYTP
jgi:hypothetical protein